MKDAASENAKDDTFDQELVQEAKAYLEVGSEKSIGTNTLTADILPDDLKKELGLADFPVEIQNTILKLSQQLVEHAAAAAQQASGEKGFGFGYCAKTAPYRSLGATAWRGGSTAVRYSNTLRLPVNRLVMRAAGAGAAFAGGFAGHMYGCMTAARAR